MKEVELYTDGSCLGNPGPGGYAFILEYEKHGLSESGGTKNTTNNRMELTAIIEGLKKLKFACNVKVYSDSQLCVNAINSWLKTWTKNNWKSSNKKSIANVDLWQEYLKHAQIHDIKAIWLKAHNGHRQNEIVDSMALAEAKKYKNK